MQTGDCDPGPGAGGAEGPEAEDHVGQDGGVAGHQED